MGEPLPVDLTGALTGFREAYSERHEDLLVLEAISNTIDAKAMNVQEEFQKNHEVNNVKQKIEKAFYEFLIDIGFDNKH